MNHTRLRVVLCGTFLIAPISIGFSDAPSGHPAAPPAEHGDGHKKPIGHRFEHAEDWVKEFDGPERDAWQRPAEVVAALGEVANKTVVDLGAGTGYFLPYLSRAVGATGKILALDLEPDMVRYLGERAKKDKLANVEAKKVAIDDPGLTAGSVDRVLIVDVWHHVPDRVAYAKKLRAALAPHGEVCIVDFTLESRRGPPKAHRLSPAQLKKELQEAGLIPELKKSSLPDQYIMIGRRPE